MGEYSKEREEKDEWGWGLTPPGMEEDNCLLPLSQRVQSLYLDTIFPSPSLTPFSFLCPYLTKYNMGLLFEQKLALESKPKREKVAGQAG